MKHNLTITVSGPAKSGKTTVGALIVAHLRGLGVPTSFADVDGMPKQLDTNIALLKAAKNIEVVVHTVQERR
jgi:adenylylsulfate kinase-like enzyme